MNDKIKFEKSSGNIFTDLEIENAEELQTRALVGFHIVQLLKNKTVKQREISELLNIKQAEVSHLLNGHFSRFSIDRLLEFLKKMDQKVTIQIAPRTHNENFHEVRFGA